mgnify:CR=1 FL=1
MTDTGSLTGSAIPGFRREFDAARDPNTAARALFLRGDHLASGTVANAQLANMAQSTVKGRAAAAGTGVPTDLSVAQLFTILGTRFKVGSFTRDVSVASGTQAVTGVGFQPTAIICFASISTTTAASWGMSDGPTNGCILDFFQTTADTYAPNTVLIELLVTSANFYIGSISTFDSDGFTISWTKTGTPTGTATIKYLALR